MNTLKGFLATCLLIIASGNTYAIELNAPQQVLQDTSDLLHDIIQNNKDRLDDRTYVFEVVNDVIEPRVDLNKISKLVLGKHWRKASPHQRTQFQKEFKNLLVNTYATAFKQFDDWSVHFLPMSLDHTKKRVVVKTQVLVPKRPPIAVNYRMARNKNGQWKAYDIIIEGISMVTNYKSSFASSIKRSGNLENVIQELVKKNQRSEEPNELTAQTEEKST